MKPCGAWGISEFVGMHMEYKWRKKDCFGSHTTNSFRQIHLKRSEVTTEISKVEHPAEKVRDKWRETMSKAIPSALATNLALTAL